MKYIDTNVIVRLITNDVPELTRQAVDMLDGLGQEDVVVLDAVIAEACFVLEFNPTYKLPRSVIYDGLLAILDSTGASRGDRTNDALDLYVRQPKLDYVDCLLCVLGDGNQGSILTFDKDLIKTLG